MLEIVRDVMQRRYPSEPKTSQDREPIEPSNSLFAALFKQQSQSGGDNDESDKYLSIGIVQSSSFIDVLSWWSARKESLPRHYRMAMGYYGTPATSTTCERANSAAGREFSCTRQSLSSSAFVMTMCLLRSWTGARIVKIPKDRAQAASTAVEPNRGEMEKTTDQLAEEQEEWNEEILDEDLVQVLNNQFDEMVKEACEE
jgi:hypothetical protein